MRYLFLLAFLTACSSFSDTHCIAKKGDVDNDGKVTAADASLVFDAANGFTSFNYCQAKSADFNNNSKVDADDAKLIFNYFMDQP